MNFTPKVGINPASSVLPAPHRVALDAEALRQFSRAYALRCSVGPQGVVRFHAPLVTKLVADCQEPFVTNLDGDANPCKRYVPEMVTKRQPQQQKRAQAKRHLYIAEWMATRKLSDQALGDKMGVPRQTIYRWRTQEHRLDPQKLVEIASALEVTPTDLWRPPGHKSIDALLADASPDQVTDTFHFVERFILKP